MLEPRIDQLIYNLYGYVMAANTRLASAVQILCAIAYLGDGTTSLAIANSLRTNPVVVLRLLKLLEQAGLVRLRAGRDGGVAFAQPPDKITLKQVYAAVEAGGEVFALREGGNPRCPVNKVMPRVLGPVFTAASQAVGDVLERTTIGSLARPLGSGRSV